MNHTTAHFIPIFALKLIKCITEIFFIVIVVMIVSSMAISMVHTPSLIIFPYCLGWVILAACTIYSVHSQKQEIGHHVTVTRTRDFAESAEGVINLVRQAAHYKKQYDK